MNKKKWIFTAMVAAATCSGCSKDDVVPFVVDGGQTIEVPQSGGSYTLTNSNYEQWWLIGVSMKNGDGEAVRLYQDTNPTLNKTGKEYCGVKEDSYSFTQTSPFTEVECNIGANTSGEERTFVVDLEAWDFFDKVTFHQKAQ